MASNAKLIRVKSVVEQREQSRAKVYQDVEQGLLPPPIKVGTSSFWIEHEIHACNDALVAGLSDMEMRAFVADLISKRISKKQLYQKHPKPTQIPVASVSSVHTGEV